MEYVNLAWNFSQNNSRKICERSSTSFTNDEVFQEWGPPFESDYQKWWIVNHKADFFKEMFLKMFDRFLKHTDEWYYFIIHKNIYLDDPFKKSFTKS